MALKIYNSLTRKKEILKPIKDKKINLFVCGPTVYDFPHLGHARIAIFFDSFVKYLKHLKYDIFYLQNITDIDDKILLRAKEKGVFWKDLAKTFEKEYLKSMKTLGINSVSKYARATQHIKEIISQVKRLKEKGFAYEIKGNGIYYDISKFKDYGKLAGRTTLNAEDGVSRIDYAKEKRNRGDFCLWKFKEQENEPSWPSPWGPGRPGWHIEDTAITEKFFGPQYDIHGGGRDLIFPHHEAEIAQMEAISGKKPLVRYWMHIGFLTVNGQKMSKSLGNFILIDDFLKRWSPQCLRFYLLKSLWCSPLDYTESAVLETKSSLEKIEDFLRKILVLINKKKKGSSVKILSLLKNTRKNFYQELDDNFNIPEAFAQLFEFIKEANKLIEKDLISSNQAKEIYRFFQEINKIFGIIDFKKINVKIPLKIKKLIKERERYRKNQEWEKADIIRKEIEKEGYFIEDTKEGPLIKKI